MVHVLHGVLKEYIRTHDEYTKLYGEQTVVLIEIGSFYELYSVVNDEMNVGPDLYALSSLVNLSVTRKNKNISEISPSNSLMMGVPSIAYQKYRDMFLDNGYTVVKMDQITEPPNIERQVVEVCSPGTTIDYNSSRDTNYLVSIYIGVYPTNQEKLYCVGLSAIDISTGTNYVSSVQSSMKDTNKWTDEIFRFIHNYNPREIIVHFDVSDFQVDKSNMCNEWNISEKNTHWNILCNKEYESISYQNDYYRKLYDTTGYLSPLECIGFETAPVVALSHIYMMEFIHIHKVENIRECKRPIHLEEMNHLSLSYNCMYQLYVIHTSEHSSESYNSLMSLLNRCKTPMGRRLCKQRILHPIVDPTKLQERYEMIESFQKDTFDSQSSYLYDTMIRNLTKIIDIERGFRKMSVGSLCPCEFFNAHQSYHYINELFKYLHVDYPSFLQHYIDVETGLSDYVKHYSSLFIVDKMASADMKNMNRSIFHTDIYPEIDAMSCKINSRVTLLQQITDKLGFYIDKHKTGVVKLSYTDSNGYQMLLTQTRAKKLKERLQNLSQKSFVFSVEGPDDTSLSYTFLISDIISTMKSKKSDIVLTHPHILELTESLVSLEERMKRLNRTYYLTTIDTLYKTHKDLFSRIVDCVSTIDIYSCFAKLSTMNGYCKPLIKSKEDMSSYMVGESMRHPLVEKIQTDVPYVPNDISFHKSGMLLFGTNACGKSTLMKSVGLSLIMAQAGCFVPCKQFTYYPYTQIFTRILNNDNLFRGQSSYTIEISELRNILKRANERSLVLGDELCSGTEQESALCVVGAGLHTLSKLKCSYMFTSHLHMIPQIPLVQQIDNMEIYHLEVTYHKDTQILEYIRTLQPGQGPSVYGLEVCKAMDMGDEFMSIARNIQLTLHDTNKHFLSCKSSAYNTNVKMDMCGVCGNQSEETHHIMEQKTANKDGLIQHFHKNEKYNLVPLCKSCHHKTTHENLRIHGYKMTSQGPTLEFEYVKQHSASKKYTREHIQLVKSYKSKIDTKQLSKTQLIKELEIHHQCKMSSGTLTKILNDTY